MSWCCCCRSKSQTSPSEVDSISMRRIEPQSQSTPKHVLISQKQVHHSARVYTNVHPPDPKIPDHRLPVSQEHDPQSIVTISQQVFGPSPRQVTSVDTPSLASAEYQYPSSQESPGTASPESQDSLSRISVVADRLMKAANIGMKKRQMSNEETTDTQGV